MQSDDNLPVGVVLSDRIHAFDSIRRKQKKQGFLFRLTTAALQKGFPGIMLPRALRGSIVAADVLVEALVRESALPPELFVFSGSIDAAQKRVESWDISEKRRRGIRISSIENLIGGRSGAKRLKAWFNPLPGINDREGVEWSQAIRQSCGDAVYPITILTHGLSYHRELYDYFLRIFLEGTYECDSFICTSRASREALLKIIAYLEEEFHRTFDTKLRYKGRADLIPLCIDSSTFTTDGKIDARDQLKISREHFLVLMLGRLSPLKADLYPFFPVLKSLIERNPQRQLLWVVAGTEEEGYTQLLQQHARRFGLKEQIKIIVDPTDATKMLLMQAADAFVSPTDCLTESFGLTIIEAMASGVPQVVPDWNGYRDTVRHGETGFLVPTRWTSCSEDLFYTGATRGWIFDQFATGQSIAVDMGEMERYLHLLINNEQLRSNMADCSRRRALEHYSFKAVARQYNELWNELDHIAGGIPSPPSVAQLTRPRYHHFFGHYASDTLADETALHITSAGRHISRAQKITPTYPAFFAEFNILDEEILRAVLELVGSRGGTPANSDSTPSERSFDRLGGIVESLRTKSTYHPDHLRRHIMWLIKYGFIVPVDSHSKVVVEPIAVRAPTFRV